MNHLKEIRKQKGIGQIELANLSGISIRSIRAYEYGETDFNNVPVCIVYRIAKILECTIEELIDVDMLNL